MAWTYRANGVGCVLRRDETIVALGLSEQDARDICEAMNSHVSLMLTASVADLTNQPNPGE